MGMKVKDLFQLLMDSNSHLDQRLIIECGEETFEVKEISTDRSWNVRIKLEKE